MTPTIVKRYLHLETTSNERFRAILWDCDDQGCSHIENIVEGSTAELVVEECVKDYAHGMILVKTSDGRLEHPDCLTLTEAALATL